MFEDIISEMEKEISINKMLGTEVSYGGRTFLILQDTKMENEDGTRIFLAFEKGVKFAPVIVIGGPIIKKSDVNKTDANP